MVSIVVSLVSLMHSFHVSVSDMKYKEEQKSIQVSTRIFLDDLELALRNFSGQQSLDILEKSEWESVQNMLGEYLLTKVTLKDEKGRVYELHYLGAEVEDDVMWCYLEVEKVKKIKSITVTNTILHEVWEDQENLVHFRAFGDVKSARLYVGGETKLFDWQ